MPGNDGCGGFASHVLVPAAGLCPVPDCTRADQPLGKAGVTLRSLSVVADAASTAWQSVQRSGLRAGMTAVVVGAGGVGIYAVQIARALGARVVAVDRDAARLEQAMAFGAELALSAERPRRELRRLIREFVEEEGRAFGVRVFECSGSAAGQELAFELLGPAGVLLVVGYTRQKVGLRLSRLMALDARAIGNWGCAPRHYPKLLDMVLAGEVSVTPLVREFPLGEVQEVLAAVRRRELIARPVLVPGR
jgi:6-hydroxycyclohex-1-ene-1-carbonyl-CoA dehydrogenase